MEKMKWGIIGCGGIADRRTIPGLVLSDIAQCYAVMDLNEEAVERVKEKYGATVGCTDVDTLLKQDIDAVYIATPVGCHKEQAFKAADAGVHILLEKPMGLTTDDAQEIADYCNKKGVKLGVGFMMRFHDVHVKIKEMIQNGVIGTVVSAYAKFNCDAPASELKWRQYKANSGGGTMMDMGIHCIDLLQHMTNLKTTEVIGLCGNQIHKYPDTEDAASAVLRMNNGALFTVEANFNISDEIGGCKFEIYGTKGVISATGTVGQTESGTVTLTVLNGDETVTSKEVDYISGNMYTKEIDGFTRAISGEIDVPVTAQEGIFNQKIVEAVYESQESGKCIKL